MNQRCLDIQPKTQGKPYIFIKQTLGTMVHLKHHWNKNGSFKNTHVFLTHRNFQSWMTPIGLMKRKLILHEESMGEKNMFLFWKNTEASPTNWQSYIWILLDLDPLTRPNCQTWHVYTSFLGTVPTLLYQLSILFQADQYNYTTADGAKHTGTISVKSTSPLWKLNAKKKTCSKRLACFSKWTCHLLKDNPSQT